MPKDNPKAYRIPGDKNSGMKNPFPSDIADPYTDVSKADTTEAKRAAQVRAGIIFRHSIYSL